MKNVKNKRQHKQLKYDHLVIYIKHTVGNMSSYVLSDEEQLALTFGLDQHVPVKSDTNLINTEFGNYFQNIKSSITNISHRTFYNLKLNYCQLVKNIATLKYLINIGK